MRNTIKCSGIFRIMSRPLLWTESNGFLKLICTDKQTAKFKDGDEVVIKGLLVIDKVRNIAIYVNDIEPA